MVTLWLDPVCPFSWNTARWLRAAADKAGFSLEIRPMNLAVLNEGRELPPPQQARMNDSRTVGRLMAALRDELGADAFSDAYFAFGQLYFDQSAPVDDDDLATSLLRSAGASRTTAAAMTDPSWDPAVRLAHKASQSALGDIGGSPLVTIGGHTVFGPGAQRATRARPHPGGLRRARRVSGGPRSSISSSVPAPTEAAGAAHRCTTTTFTGLQSTTRQL